MSDQDENIQNNEEYMENYEENEGGEEMIQGEEEYEEENMNENGEEEEGQDVYAFDIQINEDSYLLVIGKTDENKLLLRLIDKEDENKPFFQNEFSLEDLRNLNPFFNNIDDENIAFQYIIGNLNDSDKEIKILDQEKIKLSISINEEGGKIDISFVLFKTINDFEGEEDNQNELIANEGEGHIEHEGDLEEGVELMENLIGGPEGDEQIEEGEIDIKKLGQHLDEENNKEIVKNNKSSNLPLQIEGNQSNIASKSIEKKEITKTNVNGVETTVEKKEITRISSSSNKNQEPEEKKEITIVTQTKIEPESKKQRLSNKEENIQNKNQQFNNQIIQDNNEQIILVKEELINTINALNENFNNQLIKMKQELKQENENKINEMKNIINKKDNDLNDMKNKFDIINKKMLDIENNLNENKKIITSYEIKINEINNKVENVSDSMKNINKLVNDEIEKNNKKIKSDIDDISKQMNEKLKMRKSIESDKKQKEEPKNVSNINYDEIINELNANIQEIKNQVGEIQNEIDNNKINEENNLKVFDEKLNNIEEKLEQNNIAIVNIENDNKLMKSSAPP